MELTLFRIFAGVTGIVLGRSLSDVNLVSIVFALALSHNALAFVYSESQRSYLTRTWRQHLVPLSLLAAVTLVTSVLDRPPIYFLFAAHHVCNETFFAQKRFQHSSGSLALARGVFHSVVFFLVTRAELEYFGLFVPVMAWAALLACSAVAYLYMVRRQGGASLKQDLIYEAASLSFAVLSLATVSGLLDYVLIYHFGFWAVYPLQRLRSQGRAGAYVGLNVALFSFAFIFTPLGFDLGRLDVDRMSYLTRMTAFFHFFSSMALSQAHPLWLRRWFFASDKAAAAPAPGSEPQRHAA